MDQIKSWTLFNAFMCNNVIQPNDESAFLQLFIFIFSFMSAL